VRTAEGDPIPPNTLAELRRDMERKRLVHEQILKIEKARLEQLRRAPKAGPNLMVLLLMRVIGIGIDTADMLVKEVLSRNLRDRRAVARYGGLTGSPDESGKRSLIDRAPALVCAKKGCCLTVVLALVPRGRSLLAGPASTSMRVR
jgi:transposase